MVSEIPPLGHYCFEPWPLHLPIRRRHSVATSTWVEVFLGTFSTTSDGEHQGECTLHKFSGFFPWLPPAVEADRRPLHSPLPDEDS